MAAANQPQFVGTPGSTGFLNCSAQAPGSGGDNNGFETDTGAACADGGGNAADMDSGMGHRRRARMRAKTAMYSVTSISLSRRGPLLTASALAWTPGWTMPPVPARCVLSFRGTVARPGPQPRALRASQLLSLPTRWGTPVITGRSWLSGDISNANFRMRVTDVSSNNARDFFLDWAALEVYYTAPPPVVCSCNYANQKASSAKNADIEIFRHRLWR